MNTQPTLLIISFSPLTGDARILKQLAAFTSDYTVTTVGHGPAPEGVVEHIRIPDELAIWRYPRLLVMLKQYRRAYRGNAAVEFVESALAGRQFDVVLANDVDAVPVAQTVKSRGGLHADLHEYSPRLHEELLRFRLFVKPFYEWMCRTHVARASSWSTVSNGLLREYKRKFGFQATLVTNAAPYQELTPTPVPDPIRFVHSGAGLRNRQLDEMIRGFITLPDATFDLYLTANDPEYIAELRAMAAPTNGRIQVHDPVPYEELISTLNDFDMGVFVLPPTNFSYEWALPNKIFDFAQARLGVVVGPSPEMAEYVTRFEYGVVTKGFSADDLSDAIRGLTRETVAQLKANAHRHAAELSAESQIAIWKGAVDTLAARALESGLEHRPKQQ